MGATQPRRLEEYVAHEVVLMLALLSAALLQTALLPRPLGFPPNLVLLLVVCKALLDGPSRAARWAFYGGIALDLCADTLLGTHALALLIVVLVTAVPLSRMSRSNWLLPLLGALIGAVAYHAVLGLVTMLVVAPFTPRMYLLIVMLPDVLAALVPVLPLFLVWRWLRGRSRGEVPVDVY